MFCWLREGSLHYETTVDVGCQVDTGVEGGGAAPGKYCTIIILHTHNPLLVNIDFLQYWELLMKKRSETQIDLIKFLIASGRELGMLINSHCSPDLYFMLWKLRVLISNSREWSSHRELPPY